MSDDMVIDSATLRNLAQIIVSYCNRQNEILDSFFKNMNALSGEWQDDATFSRLMEEIRSLTMQGQQYFDELCTTYPAIFINKADQIDARPVFGGTSYSPGYTTGSSSTGSSGGRRGSSGDSPITEDPLIQSLYQKYSRLSDQNKEAMLSGGTAKNMNQFVTQCWKEYRTNPNCGDFAKTVSLKMMQLQGGTGGGDDDDDTPPVLKRVRRR